MRVKRLLFILVALMMTLATMLSFSSAFAGVDRFEIVNSSAEANWKIVANDNITLGSDMRFTAQSASNATAAITTKFTTQPEDGVPYFARIVSNITVNSFASNASYFSYSFGLQKNTTKIGGAGYSGSQLEIYLAPASTAGKIKVGIRYANGADLAAADNAGLLQAQNTFNVSISATATPVVDVYFGDEAHISYNLGGYPYGYAGIGQNCTTGSNVVTIDDFSFYTYSYQRPSNYDFTEDFDYGTEKQYDSRLIYSKAAVGFMTPSYLTVEENPTTHNRYLRFNNTGFGYFATRDQYSNFEMTFHMFDVPQATFTKKIGQGGVDENGDGIPDVIANGQMVIGLGIVNSPSSIVSYSVGAKLCMYIGWSRTSGVRETMIRDGNYHYFGYDSNNNPRNAYYVQDAPKALDGTTACNPFELGDMEVKISVIDGIFAVWFVPYADYQTQGDAVWNNIDPLLSYDMGYTPNGRVMFAITGNESAPTSGSYGGAMSGNASIDDLKVVNRDSNPNSTAATRIGFKTNLMAQRAETYYRYEDFYDDNDLLGARIESGVINNSFLAALFDFSTLTTVEIIILIVSAVLIIATVVVVVLVIVKKGKKPDTSAEETLTEETAENPETTENEEPDDK